MNQETDKVLSDERARIGLALSGGGFRASLYHLGTIRYLEEAGVMPRVEVISTVSGGSIIGAYYLVEMERRLRAESRKNRLDLCDDIINEFSKILELNFRMRALVFYPFYHPVQTLLALLRLQHAGDTMAKAFEKHLFAPSLRIGDLPVQILERGQFSGSDGAPEEAGKQRQFKDNCSRILINTTSLITGRRVVFSRESDTGIKAQIKRLDPNNIMLARAVGASAAVPGLFKPLRIGNEILMDGGVVDNQGIESLLDYFELSEESLNLLPDAFRQPPEFRVDSSDASGSKPVGNIYFIVSDGAGQFSIQADGKATRAGSAARSMDVLQAANRRKILKLLLNKKNDTYIKAFSFTHMAMNLKGRTDGDRLPSELIVPTSELRTDLDEFSRLERDALIYHGYSLMKRQIVQYCAGLKREQVGPSLFKSSHFSWPPPFLEMCAPTDGFKERAKTARSKIGKFLRVGQSAIFRDIKRFFWPFAPLLFIIFLLGHTLSRLLISLQINGSGQSLRDILLEYVRTLIESFLPSLQGLPDRLGSIINYLIPLEDLRECFEKGGYLAGALEFLVTLICIALSFYLALWFYWQVKQWCSWPARREQKMLDKIRAIDDKDKTNTVT